MDEFLWLNITSGLEDFLKLRCSIGFWFILLEMRWTGIIGKLIDCLSRAGFSSRYGYCCDSGI